MRRRHYLALLCFCLLGLGTAYSQILPAHPSVDLFLGYSYVNVDTNHLTPRQSLNGWSSSSSLNFSRWFALEGEASGYYRNNLLNSGVNARDYSFTAGPRLNFGRRFFVHALFGEDHLTQVTNGSTLLFALVPAGAAGYGGGSSTPTSTSNDAFAMIFGGGVQWKLAQAWSVRTSIDYVGTHHLGEVQNNVRVGGGIVYTLHSKQRPIFARE